MLSPYALQPRYSQVDNLPPFSSYTTILNGTQPEHHATITRTQYSMRDSYLGKRFEFKYFLSHITAKQIESFLVNYAKLTPDPNSEKGAYTVNSLYFDTPHLSDYREKDGSILIRKKVRARMYDTVWHDGLERVWLEVKHKRNMNIRKTRGSISGDDWRQFITNNNPLSLLAANSEKPADVRNFAETYMRQFYRPMTVVRYKRKAYLADFTSLVRITFDYDIGVGRYETAATHQRLIPVSHQAVIMEVKFNNKLPWWFTELLARFDLRRTDFSKYRNSVAVMRGIHRIPVNK